MQKKTILRGKAERRTGPYPLAEIPHSLAVEIGRRVVHRLAVGQGDITGDDFGGMFADAISGVHRGKPLGLADVEWNGCAWCVKTVKSDSPFTATRVRLISGRNAPVYSAGIQNPFDDVQATGRAVLEVWNSRVDESLKAHDDLRVLVFVRNMSTLEFAIFEREANRFVPTEYTWVVNKRGNFEGYDASGKHCFTWQPSGGQFTVMQDVPASAYRFSIRRRPITMEEHHVLRLVKWNEDWIVPFTPS